MSIGRGRTRVHLCIFLTVLISIFYVSNGIKLTSRGREHSLSKLHSSSDFGCLLGESIAIFDGLPEQEEYLEELQELIKELKDGIETGFVSEDQENEKKIEQLNKQELTINNS
jgi:hypothetical protein